MTNQKSDAMNRLYTAEEVIAVITAIIKAERARAAKIMRYHQSLMASTVERV
jgi:hypothetical protein